MQTFEAVFGSAPEITASAPGWVNLLGEHTDYQGGGFVLPTAIPQRATVGLGRNGTGTHVLYSANLEQTLRVISRLSRRFEWIYTPKHASWLNMAELEWSASQCQCLGQRLASKEVVEHEIHAWETDRNARSVSVNWQFSTPATREKLRRHDPAQE
ncbi:galactokinase family protein [Deinococcus marmoris]|uniref:Galactokinase n=1 Tax=Deinococcus marmoris TaxID=249408 RepID=A0A1U7P594_9DEIO|nr:galactokinase family protein [Deinococcus marmoris]OLV20342.1 Galactokinase [Deinococcus marmoris]